MIFLSHCLIALGIFFSSFQNSAYAKTPNATLQASPAFQQIQLNPNTTHHGVFSIQNTGSEPLDFTLSIYPYQVSGVDYNVDLATTNSRTKITDWIKFDYLEGTIEPRSTKDIPYTITVPSDVASGGQYAVLSAETKDFADNETDSNIKVVGSVGMVLFAQISGDTQKSGSLTESKVNPFLINGSIVTETTISNSGNIDFPVETSLRITKIFNNRVVYDNSDDPNIKYILPETSRLIIDTWQDTPKIGIFKVAKSVSFLDQSFSEEKIVIVCPLWLLIALTTIFILVIMLIVLTVFSYIRKQKSKHSF